MRTGVKERGGESERAKDDKSKTRAREGHQRARAAAVAQMGVVHPNVPARDDKAQYHAVMVAIWSNVAIAVSKLVAWMATGSSAMLAEFIHSCVDVLNQYLLRLGLLAARRAATADHPYGYTRDLFVWSLIAGVGIFCFGGGISVGERHACAGRW